MNTLPNLLAQRVEISAFGSDKYPQQIHVTPTPRLLFPPVLIEYVPLDTIDWEDAEITLTGKDEDADADADSTDTDCWETEGGRYCLSCGFTLGFPPMFGCLSPEVHTQPNKLGVLYDRIA